MRKTSLLPIFIIFVTQLVNAQISKGSVYLGGSLGYSNTTEEHTGTPPIPTNGELKTLTISPAVGIAIKPNLIAGIDFTYGQNTYDNINGIVGKYDTKTVGGGVFLRRYYPLLKNFYAYGELNAGYAHSSSSQEGFLGSSVFTSGKSDGWSVGAVLSPGLSYNVTKALYLEMGFAGLLQLSYGKTTQTDIASPTSTPYVTTRKSFTLNSSLSNSSNLNIGVRFILPKK